MSPFNPTNSNSTIFASPSKATRTHSSAGTARANSSSSKAKTSSFLPADPLLPAKERPTSSADWMTTDAAIACPDPNCGARFRIERIGRRRLRHGDCTVVPLDVETPEPSSENTQAS